MRICRWPDWSWIGGRVRQVFIEEAACRIDGGLHIRSGAVDAATEIELQCYRRLPKPTGRRHLR